MARHLLDAICTGNDVLAKEIIQGSSYRGIDSQTSTRDGTALFFCCSRGILELVVLLVKSGACLEARTKWSATPLHAAADHDHVDVVKYLINVGANINAQTHNGDTPLHLAAFRGHADLVRLLVQLGADVTLVNESNLTPLDEAARHGHCNIEDFLSAFNECNHCPAYTKIPSNHLVTLSPPTDTPSLLPSQLSASNFLSSSLSGISVQPSRGDDRNCTSYHPTTARLTSPSRQPVTTDSMLLAEPISRIPEESLDPSVFVSMAASNALCVPALGKKCQRRTSSASSVSMTSEHSLSGPRSDDSSAMSSISDVSSCGGDFRREDFEGHDLDATNFCSLMEELGKSQPLSNSNSLRYTLNRTYSTPASSSLSGFSDSFNFSPFSLESLVSVSSSNVSSDCSGASLTNSASNTKHNLSPLVCPPPHVKDVSLLEKSWFKRPPVRREYSTESDRDSLSKRNKSSSAMSYIPVRQFSMPILEDDSNHWSTENQTSNNLSSIKLLSPSSSSTTPSMTFVNIPVHDLSEHTGP